MDFYFSLQMAFPGLCFASSLIYWLYLRSAFPRGASAEVHDRAGTCELD